jgi:hypothetical protein
MNDLDSTETQQFILKRIPSFFDADAKSVASADVWVIVLVSVILAFALVYMALMYYKDSRSVGGVAASVLGFLRACVYCILVFVFLLPAMQKSRKTPIRSKAVLLFDTSLSMIDTRDDTAEQGQDPNKLPTRQDKVLAFLNDERVEFMKRLTDKNAVTAYRFGSRLDEGYLHFTRGRFYPSTVDEITDGPPERFFRFTGGRFHTRGEWEKLARQPARRRETSGSGAMPEHYWSAWLKPTAHVRAPDDWLEEKTKAFYARYPQAEIRPNAEQEGVARFYPSTIDDLLDPMEDGFFQFAGRRDLTSERFAEAATYNARVLEASTFEGTNVYQSLADALAREQNNLTRGIVLISDGRSHLGSLELIEEIRRRAKEKEIPILVVGVGAVRQDARWEIVDLRHPKQIQPDDPFRLVAEVKGDNLPGEVFPIKLEITKVKITPEEKGADGQVITPKKETKIPMTLVEQRPPKKRSVDEKPMTEEKEPPLEEVGIGDSIILTPPDETAFDTGPRPRAAVEFQVEPAILARAAAQLTPAELRKVLPSVAAGKDEKALEALIERDISLSLAALAAKGKGEVAAREALSKFTKIKKWGLGETKPDEEYRFKVYLPDKHKLDRTPSRTHLERTGGLRVLKKPLSVLVFSSSSSKDYQFLRELLIRETQKDLARVTVVLQPTNRDETSHPPGTVQGLPEHRFRAEFPTLYRPDVPITAPESEEAINDLASYDVIVALDPDWTRIRDATGQHIARWIENGGGLVVVGGGIYTKRLSRPGDYKAKLQPIIDVLPVVLKDIDTVEVDRKPDQPWNLVFEPGAGADMEFLNLGEEGSRAGVFQQLWEEKVFPRGGDSESGFRTGFYSFYPVKKVIPGSRILARFGDPKAKTDDGDKMPYFVVSDPSSPKRVVWIGSTETWRLRQGKEAYHERFWTKLLRYAGARTQGKVNKLLTMELGGPYKTDQFIQVDAKAQGPDGKPFTGDELNLLIKPRGVGLAVEKKLRKRSGTDIYSDQFRLEKAGTYDVELTVPGRPGLTENGTLEVTESNPEKDDTRPDFDTLYKLASDAEELKNRIPQADYDTLLRALTRPKLEGDADKPKGTEKEKPRLFFNLNNAQLIPNCIDKDETTQTSRGKPEDLWDTGWWQASDGKPILSKVLIVVVGLLSLEWLIRKLLRLA